MTETTDRFRRTVSGPFEWLCPRCGSFTYQYDNVLPSQAYIQSMPYDNRLREHVVCVSCAWDSKDVTNG